MLNKHWFTLATAAISSLVIGTSAAQAVETFSVDNIALNTNWYFRRIDGNPRMSVYTRNDNDRDQQFDRLPGNRGGILLRHRSTGRCLNAHSLWNGAEINVWPCNPNDPDQNWNLVPVSDNRLLIKRTGTNLCVDTPNRSNEGKVHLWTCDGNNPNQRWRSSAGQSPSGYRSNIESVLRNFFSNTANTNGQNWSQKTITEMWDRVGGESAQFPGGNFTSGDAWQVDMPSDLYGVYQDLSNTIFGSVKAVNTGYAYDQGYYNYFRKWHAGLDIQAPNGTSVKAVVSGTATLIQKESGNYFIGIKGDDGKLWIYGHLSRYSVTPNTRVNVGQTVGYTNNENHLHLEVQNTHTYQPTYGAHSDRNFVLNATISPLHAYWIWRNR